MRRQKWKKWVMAAVMAGMLAEQTGFLTAQAADMPETEVLTEEIQEPEIEAAALSEVSEVKEEVQALGITYTVDGDTVTITGEGTQMDCDYGLWGDALPRAKHVKFENCKIIGSMECFFYVKEDDELIVESVDLSGLDTSNVTDMFYMFCDCSRLVSVNMSGVDTSNVTNMMGMFAGCSSLTNVDVSGFDTSNVMDMEGMFSGCSSLMNIDVRGFDTSNVMDMEGMFFDCSSLTSLDVSGFDTSNVMYMRGIFSGCSSLTNLDVSGFDTGNVTNMSDMFSGCSQLTNLNVSSFNTSSVTNMSNMFSGCSSLTNLDVSRFDTSLLGSGGSGSIGGMFSGCSSLVSIDLSSFDLSKVNGYVVSSADVLSGTNITVIKTPHALGWEYIDLPDTFIDPSGRETNQVTQDFCNTTLIRKSADVPAVPTPTPTPGPMVTPDPTPGPVVDDQTQAQVGSFVSRMYTEALNRDSEPAGQEYWTNRLLNHETDGAGIAHGFIMSEEFQKRNLTDEEFVDVLYRTFLNREEGLEEQSYWLSKLADGNSRGYVLAGFVNSEEFNTFCDSYGIIRGTLREDGIPRTLGIRPFVERLYTKMLNRTGEKEKIDYWADEIIAGRHTPEDVAKRFYQSEEFINRNLNDSDYVETLYETFLDRSSEAEGKAYWLRQINAGMDRDTVLEGFSKSQEFANILEEYGS